MLLAAAMGCERIALYARFDSPVPPPILDSFREMVRRRAAREPLQYILGSVVFRRAKLAVGPGSFIPRPETEELVGAALERIRPMPDEVIETADLCTGSGCIAIALCIEEPRVRVTAMDISGEALAWAARNIAAHGLAGEPASAAPSSVASSPGALPPGWRVRLARGDLFDPLGETMRRAFHLIVANPPYIPREAAASLAPEIAMHEPPEALFADDEGFAVAGRILAIAHEFLRPGGWVLVEIGENHGDRARAAMAACPAYECVEVLRDLSGKERIAVARRR